MKENLNFNILIAFKFFTIIITFYFFFNCHSKTKKISIIIPTNNREKTIYNSIESALKQTYNNIEVIIVDDCSTDNTKFEIYKIKDKRIKYIKLPKQKGAAYARNIGIKMAGGKYISFQDSDDIYHPDKLKKQIENMLKNKSDFDFCKIFVHFNNRLNYVIPDNRTENNIIKGNIYNELLNNGNFISTQAILVKKKYIKKFLFDVDMPRLQDFDLVLRMLKIVKVSYTNETLVDMYIQNNSITLSSIKLKISIERILAKNYNLNVTQNISFTN